MYSESRYSVIAREHIQMNVLACGVIESDELRSRNDTAQSLLERHGAVIENGRRGRQGSSECLIGVQLYKTHQRCRTALVRYLGTLYGTES